MNGLDISFLVFHFISKSTQVQTMNQPTCLLMWPLIGKGKGQGERKRPNELFTQDLGAWKAQGPSWWLISCLLWIILALWLKQHVVLSTFNRHIWIWERKVLWGAEWQRDWPWRDLGLRSEEYKYLYFSPLKMALSNQQQWTNRLKHVWTASVCKELIGNLLSHISCSWTWNQNDPDLSLFVWWSWTSYLTH